MKTPVFVPLVLFVLLAVGAWAAPLTKSEAKKQKARSAVIATNTACIKCLNDKNRVIEVATQQCENPHLGKFDMERYDLKCPKCGTKWRRWEVLPTEPPKLKSPADSR